MSDPPCLSRPCSPPKSCRPLGRSLFVAMGRVTVFVTHHCTFCRTVETCVHKAMVELRKEDPELRLVVRAW